MKLLTTINGQISIYISPEGELDKIILAELAKGPVTIKAHSTVQVGDKNLVDCIEIIPSKLEKPTIG